VHKSSSSTRGDYYKKKKNKMPPNRPSILGKRLCHSKSLIPSKKAKQTESYKDIPSHIAKHILSFIPVYICPGDVTDLQDLMLEYFGYRYNDSQRTRIMFFAFTSHILTIYHYEKWLVTCFYMTTTFYLHHEIDAHIIDDGLPANPGVEYLYDHVTEEEYQKVSNQLYHVIRKKKHIKGDWRLVFKNYYIMDAFIPWNLAFIKQVHITIESINVFTSVLGLFDKQKLTIGEYNCYYDSREEYERDKEVQEYLPCIQGWFQELSLQNIKLLPTTFQCNNLKRLHLIIGDKGMHEQVKQTLSGESFARLPLELVNFEYESAFCGTLISKMVMLTHIHRKTSLARVIVCSQE
jgi:hypothetical protein